MRPIASPWHAAFRATGWYGVGALLPVAIAVAASEEFLEIEWPATALAWLFRALALLEWTVVATLAPAIYFLLVVLTFGARRRPIAKPPALFAGFAAGAAVTMLLFVLSQEQTLIAGCAVSAAAAAILLLLGAPAPSRPRRSAHVESLGSRRGSQPFAFGLTAAMGAFAASALHARAWTADGDWFEGAGLVLGLPFLVGFAAMLLGAVFALGAGLGALFRRGAAPAAPYGVLAGCASAVAAALIGRDGSSIALASAICSFAAGLLGTLTAAGPSGFVRRTQRRGPRRA